MPINLMEELSREAFTMAGHQCPGCGSHVASEIIMSALARHDDVYVEGNSCGFGSAKFPIGMEYNGGTNMGLDGGVITGICASLELQGALNKKKLVFIGGDGGTACMGLGNMLHAFMRQLPITILIVNNEMFAEAGNHLTSRSPLKANDKSLLKGKDFPSAPIPLLVAIAGAKYVGTATYSYPEDLVAKVDMALANQPSYIDVLVACPSGWRYPAGMTAEITRLAVQTDLYPLWESHHDENNELHFRRTVRIEERKPITDYTKHQRRFRHLTEADVAALNTYIEREAAMLDRLEKLFT